MPRANRVYLPGYVWHITQRCHQKEFLLKFARDRRRWQFWLFEAKKRFRLCILNYIVTSNHIHLLVRDQGRGEISDSLQLIAGRTAQEFNRRKGRKGAFWEDRYHATAVDTEAHLERCVTYIDLNMVRAGVVPHPGKWPDSGFWELQNRPARRLLTDSGSLAQMLRIKGTCALREARAQWVDEAIARSDLLRNEIWTQSLGVGNPTFLARLRSELGIGARYRKIDEVGGSHLLRERNPPYKGDFGAKKLGTGPSEQ